MNRIIQLSVGGFLLATLSSGCDTSNTSVTGLADAGVQGGSSATGGSGGARTGTGGTRAGVGGALGTGGTRTNAGGTLGTGGTRTGTGGAGAAAGSANLTAFCTLQGQVAAQLNCPGFTSQQAIVTPCMTDTTIPATCQTPLDATTTCLSQQPTSSFTCSTSNDGNTEINSGVCTSQANALLDCALGAVTGSCSDLTGCCAQLTGANQTTCQEVVTDAVETTCSSALSYFQSSGLCN